MNQMNEGHEKLYKVIMNQKVRFKLNYQELEELNFALTDRIMKLLKSPYDKKYMKFLKSLLLKIRQKIDEF